MLCRRPCPEGRRGQAAARQSDVANDIALVGMRIALGIVQRPPWDPRRVGRSILPTLEASDWPRFADRHHQGAREQIEGEVFEALGHGRESAEGRGKAIGGARLMDGGAYAPA